MKVVRIHCYGHSDQLKLEDIPKPEIKEDELLVKVHAAGVNPVDWKIREGYLKEYWPASFPLTLGQDFAGEVVEVGPKIVKFRPGDEVFGFAHGAYAEYAVAKSNKIAHKPRTFDFVTAAAIPTAGLTAWQVINDAARVTQGQRVLIHGAAGGVGPFAVQIAAWKGARVLATASARDAGYLRTLGAELVVDYKSERFEEKIKDVDAVIDLVGGETLARSYQVVKAGGVLVTIVDSIDEEVAKRLGIRATEFAMTQDASGLVQLVQLIDQGIVRPRISQIIPLDEARRAQELNQAGKSHGKIVLKVA